MSFVLKLMSNTSILRARYCPPIVLSGRYEISLISMECWNSISNLTSENNKFYYTVNNTQKILEIPEGSYEIMDIQNYISGELREDHLKYPLQENEKIRLGDEPIILNGNKSTFKTEILCRYSIDFTQPNNIGSILGFDKVILPPFVRHVSTGIIKILTVEELNVECNLVSNSFSNDKRSRDLYSCPVSQPPRYEIIDVTKNILF